MPSSDPVIVAFLAIIPVYIIIGCGWMARRLHWLLPNHEPPIMRIAIDLCYPCLVLSSMFGNEMLRSPLFSLEASGLGFAGVMLGIGASWCVAKTMGLKVGTGLRTFTLSAGVQNYGFFVIPIVAVLYTAPGDPMMGILMTHNTGCELAIWTVGLVVLSGGFKGISPRIFLRGPLIAVVLGLLMVWTRADTYVPTPVKQTLQMLGACTIPLCVFLFGTTMYDSWKKVSWKVSIIISGIIARLGIAPALILLLAWILPISIDLKRIMVLQAAIPAAMVPVIIAKQFGGHPALAMQITLVTTFVSFITLPLWLAFGFNYIAI
ncbi:MAG: AEC family transporter, partial [Akkermansia sp.]